MLLLLLLLLQREEMVRGGRGRRREGRMVPLVRCKKGPRIKCVACCCVLSFRGVLLWLCAGCGVCWWCVVVRWTEEGWGGWGGRSSFYSHKHHQLTTWKAKGFTPTLCTAPRLCVYARRRPAWPLCGIIWHGGVEEMEAMARTISFALLGMLRGECSLVRRRSPIIPLPLTPPSFPFWT